MNNNKLLFCILIFFLTFTLTDLYAVDHIVSYSSTDATANIQAGLDSGADRVILEYQGTGTAWKTDPLTVRSDTEFILEPGVILEAKSGYSLGGCVLTLTGTSNVTISGYGATIRMPIEEYTSGQYRHCIKANGCDNLTVEGITLEKAGGDGLYLAGTVSPYYSNDITVTDVVFDGNARQGISFMSAQNVTVTNCRFLNTGQYNTGTLAPGPRAGIDFEPNDASSIFRNISISNCYFDNNDIHGILFSLQFMDDTSSALTNISINNCTIKNSDRGIYMLGKNSASTANTFPSADIVFTNINIENTSEHAIMFTEWGDEMHCSMNNIYISTPTIDSTEGAVEIRCTRPLTAGNIELNNICILDSDYSDIALLFYGGTSTYKIKDVSGSIYALNPDSSIVYNSYYDNITVDLNIGGICGEWHFDEGIGTTLGDSSTFGNDGSFYEASWTSYGKIGNALQFDGINDTVFFPDSNSLDITDAVTVEAWIKFSDVDQQYQYIFEKGPYSTGGYRLFWNYSGNNRFYFATSNGSEHGGYTSAKSLQNGVWYHILCVDTGYDVCFYLNGEQETLYSGSHSIAATSNYLYVGGRQNGNVFDGVIDEVKIYNWPLGPEQAMDNYLYAYMCITLDFNENTGSTAGDTSYFENDGTIYGAGWVTGKQGSALEFDGVSDCVTCGNDTSLNITSGITIETWMKFSDVDQQYQHIFAKGPWTTGGYRLYWNYNGNNKLFFATSNGSEHGGYSSTKSFEDDVWYHIVCVDTLDNVYLYVNGEQETLYSGSHTISVPSTSLFLARRSSGNYFNGVIDNFRIYKKALSSDEVARLYNK